jgi:hypothetical protein
MLSRNHIAIMLSIPKTCPQEIQLQKFMARSAGYKLPVKSDLLIEFKTVVLLSEPWEVTGRSTPTSYLSPFSLMVGDALGIVSLELGHDFARALLTPL